MPATIAAERPALQHPNALSLSVRIDPSGEDLAELQRRLEARDLIARYLIDLQRDAA